MRLKKSIFVIVGLALSLAVFAQETPPKYTIEDGLEDTERIRQEEFEQEEIRSREELEQKQIEETSRRVSEGGKSYKLSVPIPTTKGTIERISNPAQYIYIAYNFAMGAGGLLAMLMIVWGGIVYTVSAGNPGKQDDAKDRIKNAVYGLVFLAGSYLLLYTIDPKLTVLSLGVPELGILQNKGPAIAKLNEIEKKIALINQEAAKIEEEANKKRDELKTSLRQKLDPAKEKVRANPQDKSAKEKLFNIEIEFLNQQIEIGKNEIAKSYKTIDAITEEMKKILVENQAKIITKEGKETEINNLLSVVQNKPGTKIGFLNVDPFRIDSQGGFATDVKVSEQLNKDIDTIKQHFESTKEWRVINNGNEMKINDLKLELEKLKQ